MRNLLLTAALLVVFVHAEAKKVTGVIIVNGRSREVTFNIRVPLLSDEPDFQRTQYKVRYYDETGKKHIFRPDEADEIRFDYDGNEIRMISCLNTIGSKKLFSSSSRIFLKLEIDGPLKLYRYYYKQTTGGYYGAPGMGYSPGVTYTADHFIFQKGNGPLKRPRSLGWKKDMLEYFSDCPALRDRIESKDLRRKEIEAIVAFYNRQCGGR
jgi:hypothetical protein